MSPKAPARGLFDFTDAEAASLLMDEQARLDVAPYTGLRYGNPAEALAAERDPKARAKHLGPKDARANEDAEAETTIVIMPRLPRLTLPRMVISIRGWREISCGCE